MIFQKKTFYLSTIIISFLLIQLTSSYKIADDIVSAEEWRIRVAKFNEDYHKLNPTSKNLELRYNEQYNYIRLYALSDIEDNSNYMTFTKDQMITENTIFDTKYAEALKDIQEHYGIDDIMNLALGVLVAKFDENSPFKSLVDLYPSQPENLYFDFWNNRKWSEPILKGTNLTSKFINYFWFKNLFKFLL